MRGIVIAIIIVLLMAVVGWLSFGFTPDRATINVETEEIREDTAGAVEATEEFVKEVADGVRSLSHESEEHIDIDIESDRE